MLGLEDYRKLAGDEAISAIYRKARKLGGKHVLEVNSTFTGGGVAEMLGPLIRLMNDLGIDTDWAILHGSPDFFEITKAFHNALQGDRINLTEIKKEVYLQANEEFYSYTHLRHDVVIVHDVQPLPIIKFSRKAAPDHLRGLLDLPQHAADEFLPAEPRIDGHDQEQVDIFKDHLDGAQGRGGIEGHPGLHALLTDGLKGAVEVHVRLHVDRQVRGPGPGEVRDVIGRALHHHVDVHRQPDLPFEAFQDGGPDREVGNEVPVHDVHMEPVGASLLGLPYLAQEVPEVGRQYGWRKQHRRGHAGATALSAYYAFDEKSLMK
jgi:hypothetical protein